MMMIERSDLEQWMSVDAAEAIVQSFFDDHETYPDHSFYSRCRGINKDIPEELWPLVLLARNLPEAEALRLAPPANEGPDGEIRISDGSIIRVQVTSSLERYGGYLVRQQLRDNGSYATRARDTLEVVEERLRRILDAIVEKEQRYRKGTDVLVIQEQSVSWGDVLEPTLKARLAEKVINSEPSKYSATYIVFNEDVYRLR
ncbi:MAG TPA: hypothetical protein VK206_03840 [Anaerolineales bacterium]|nr:hypothetical protein [Anaerolineales bacterium]